MATDRDIRGGGREPSKDDAEEGPVLVRELIEALTAAGNYLTAANNIFAAEPSPARNPLLEALQKSLAQLGRANEAARLLRDFFRRESATDDTDPQAFP